MATEAEHQTLSRRWIFLVNFIFFCLVDRTPQWNLLPETSLFAHWINQTTHAFSRAIFTLYMELKWSMAFVGMRNKCAQLGWIFLYFAEVLQYFMATWVYGLVLWPFTVAIFYFAFNTLLTLALPMAFICVVSSSIFASAIYKKRLNGLELRRKKPRCSMPSSCSFSNRTLSVIPEEPEPPEEEAPTNAGTKSLPEAQEENEPVRTSFPFSPSKTRSGKIYT